MSLLMDALRKAEEEKKQAEQGNKSETESDTQSAGAESSDAAPPETSPDESSTPASETPADVPEAESIPDPQIEFEENAEEDAASASDSALELDHPHLIYI